MFVLTYTFCWIAEKCCASYEFWTIYIITEKSVQKIIMGEREIVVVPAIKYWFDLQTSHAHSHTQLIDRQQLMQTNCVVDSRSILTTHQTITITDETPIFYIKVSNASVTRLRLIHNFSGLIQITLFILTFSDHLHFLITINNVYKHW